MALFETKKNHAFEIVALLTTVTKEFDRISMHGVRRVLLEKQGELIGLPVEKVWISKGANNNEYELQMKDCLEKYKRLGVDNVIFGDLFLQDIRRYREERLSEIGMHGVFPLWGRNTAELAKLFVSSGFRAIMCTVDPRAMDRSHCGSEFADFLSNVPPGVDPCGENGEFHTFVYDGPIFKERIDVRVGETVLRDGFYFTDIYSV
jgi:uncharacterized protein (TIGR00290 family)